MLFRCLVKINYSDHNLNSGQFCPILSLNYIILWIFNVCFNLNLTIFQWCILQKFKTQTGSLTKLNTFNFIPFLSFECFNGNIRVYIKLRQIGVPTQGSSSWRLSKLSYLSRVNAWYWKPIIVYTQFPILRPTRVCPIATQIPDRYSTWYRSKG